MTPVIDLCLMCEEGRRCLNVDQTQLYFIAWNAGTKTISSRLLSLLLPVMAASSPQWKRAAIFSCHSLKDMGQNLSFNHHPSAAL